MIDLNSAIITNGIIHQVGHKGRNERMFISKNTFEPDDSTAKLLLEYFLKPFKTQTEVYNFSHLMNIKMNEVFTSINNIFDKESFVLNSINILKHLYEESKHPNIKSGELFIIYFEELMFENKIVDAVGIFKSERKDNFFKFKIVENSLTLSTDHGINIQKLDKGCIVFNTNFKGGFKVLTYENNNNDTDYWRNDFLDIKIENDNNFQTGQFINLCKEFSQDVIQQNSGKQHQVDFINKSMMFLAKREVIKTKDFSEFIFDGESNKKAFEKYRHDYEVKNELEFEDSINISRTVVNFQKKKIKNEIFLDTNIVIKIDVKDSNPTQRFIERGYDQKRKMNYYKIYFNEEK